MKTKTLLISMITFLAVLQSYAQKGEVLISPYLGIAGSNGAEKFKSPSIGVNLDYFVSDKFSVGGVLAYSNAEINVNSPFMDTSESEVSGINIGALINYQWLDQDKFTVYSGGALGYQTHNKGVIQSGIFYQLHGGARYFFSDSFAVYSELGFGLALLKFGISFKL